MTYTLTPHAVQRIEQRNITDDALAGALAAPAVEHTRHLYALRPGHAHLPYFQPGQPADRDGVPAEAETD